ncbi:MAG: endolytic transglycosylase MltG, partial [Ruthenibacterium sp.]
AGSLNGETVKVTIPEGYTVEQIIALLAKNKVSGAEALTEAAKNATFEYEYIDNKNLGSISRLEGFLFPDTYDFYVGEKAQSALNRLIKNFDKKLTAELRTAIKAAGYTIPQVVTIASLIERETDGKDHAKIASVIYNRLNNPNAGTVGKLQIDASVLYGLPAHEGALTSADKEVDTPYNLYKYKGLPPTPIGNPGLASLNAAIAPEKTDYYYYALGKDKAHHFFKSYNEHVNFTKSAQYAGDSK